MAPQPKLLKWRLGSLNRLLYRIARILWPFQSWVLSFSFPLPTNFSNFVDLVHYNWPWRQVVLVGLESGGTVCNHTPSNRWLQLPSSLKNAKRNVRIATKPLYRDGMSSALHEEDTRGLAYSPQLFWQGSLTNQWPLYKKHSSTQHSCL